MKEFGDKVPADVKTKIEEKVASLRTSISSDDVEGMKAGIEALNQVMPKSTSSPCHQCKVFCMVQIITSHRVVGLCSLCTIKYFVFVTLGTEYSRFWSDNSARMLQEAMAMGQAVYQQQQQQAPEAGPQAGGTQSGDNVVDADFKDSNDQS